jgi:hypothetical protein
MNDLATWASIAEIFGASAILCGAIFGLVQFMEAKHRRRSQVAAELCRAFAEPELARAITLLRNLPDGIPLRDLQAMDREFESSAQVVGMSFETMGLLVHENIADFHVVQQLTGGLLLMVWRKIHVWTEETRVEHDNPRFGEWVQWLVERIEEREAEMVPAYLAHREWRPRNGRGAPR